MQDPAKLVAILEGLQKIRDRSIKSFSALSGWFSLHGMTLNGEVMGKDLTAPKSRRHTRRGTARARAAQRSPQPMSKVPLSPTLRDFAKASFGQEKRIQFGEIGVDGRLGTMYLPRISAGIPELWTWLVDCILQSRIEQMTYLMLANQ